MAQAVLSHGQGSDGQHVSFDEAVQASDESLLWGTYRPNLYFGLRPRVANSLMHGLMWFGVQDFQSFHSTRHSCEKEDELVYGYKEHDPRSGAVESIQDKRNNVELTVSWLKVPARTGGGSWGLRIEGKPILPEYLSRISLINYFGNDGTTGSLELGNDEEELGLQGTVNLKGSAAGISPFKIRIESHSGNSSPTRGPHADKFKDELDRTHFFGLYAPPGQVWKAKDVFTHVINENSHEIIKPFGQADPPDPALLYQLPNEVRTGANMYGFQRTYEGEWSVDIYFDSQEAEGPLDAVSLTAGLQAASDAFHRRFDAKFPLSDSYSDRQKEFARQLVANQLGGIGFFQGTSIIDRNFAYEWDDDSEEGEDGGSRGRQPKPEVTEPRELLSGTPSRSLFPRGFYWDEGFHLLITGTWDNDLSLNILKSWINLIDEDGWVGREQILGEEARSKVPSEFVAQYPSYGNPPTLTKAVTAYIARLRKAGLSLADLDEVEPPSSLAPDNLASLHMSSPTLARDYLTSIYDKLKRHYEWFRETQRGQIREWGRQAHSRREGYRWRGRSKTHVLTSGLDDYPRAQPPHLGELHVDLISWMGFFAKTMSEIAEFLEQDDDLAEFEYQYAAIVQNIDDLHWSEEHQAYCDLSVNEDDESIHVCHQGYVTLFPFLLGLLEPSSARLGAVLESLRDPAQMWSPYGITSLSKMDEYFHTGEDYWCSPIWIPMNYMILSALYKTYAAQPGPFQVRAATIYSELRDNLVNNTFKEWERTGFVWENYHADTGLGQRGIGFTGWSSAIALIMAEQY
ncbi:Processing alpha glucosidase I [Microbotryomycetes sp. JL221]|nr:Processing alpha glucosidase I [Microbotryomycetes sp. JL221]